MRTGIPFWRKALSPACRVVLGGIFLISGLSKSFDPVGFLFSLRGFQLFPGPLEAFLAIVVPWLEMLLGLLLLGGVWLRTVSLLLAALNLLFAGAILSVLMRGIEIDCGCFGLLANVLRLPDQADLKAVVRNLVFVAMALFLFAEKETPYTLQGCLRRKANL